MKNLHIIKLKQLSTLRELSILHHDILTITIIIVKKYKSYSRVIQNTGKMVTELIFFLLNNGVTFLQ